MYTHVYNQSGSYWKRRRAGGGKKKESGNVYTYISSKKEKHPSMTGHHIYAPLNILRHTYTHIPGETTSRGVWSTDESDRLMMRLWVWCGGVVEFEMVGGGVHGFCSIRDRWMYYIGPRQGCGDSASHSDVRNNVYSKREGGRPWERKVLGELRLQSQCFLQCFGHGALSSRELWQWWWVL